MTYLINGLVSSDFGELEGGNEKDIFEECSNAYTGGYSYEDRMKMVRMYYVCGDLDKVVREWNVSYCSLLKMSRSDWWVEEIQSLEREAAVKLKLRLLRVFDKSMTELEDRLEHGDILVMRDGSERRVPIGARDLSVIASSVFDKREKLEGRMIGVKVNERNKLFALADNLKMKVIKESETEETLILGEREIIVDEEGVFNGSNK